MNLKIQKWIASLAGLLSVWCLQAGTVDTVVTYSTAMKKEIKAVIVRPDAYDSGVAWPVVYLLHG